jgi:hypothetical protein
LEALFIAAGGCMTAHLILCQLLRMHVGWKSELAIELFAVPNAGIMGNWGFRLLRARYYLLWREQPDAMYDQGLMAKLLFMLARLTGFLFPVLMVSFFALPFLGSG